VDQCSHPVPPYQQHQQQHQNGEVQWIVVEPPQDFSQVSSDAAAVPAASVASTPAAVDGSTAAGHSGPGGPPPPVVVPKDETYQHEYDMAQRSCTAVPGFIICPSLMISAPRLGVCYFLSLTLSVCLSVCPSVCHAALSNWFFFFVSRWNRAIFVVISPCGTLQNCFLRFMI